MQGKHHFLRGLLLSTSIFIFAQNVNAEDLNSILSSNAKNYIACRQEFLKDHTNPTEAEIDAYCKTKMSPQVYCIEQGLFKSLMAKAGALSSQALVAEAPKIKNNVAIQCSAQASNVGNGAPNTGTNGSSFPPPPDRSEYLAKCAPKNEPMCLQAQESSYNAAAQKYTVDKQNFERQQAAALAEQNKQNAAQSGQSQQVALKGMSDMIGIGGQALMNADRNKAGSTDGSTTTTTTIVKNADGTSTITKTTESTTTGGTAANNSGTPKPGETIAPKTSGVDGMPTEKDLLDAKPTAADIGAQGEQKAGDVVSQATKKPEDIPAEQTHLTADARTRVQELNKSIEAVLNLANTAQANGMPFDQTKTAATQLKTKYEKFVKAKDSCVQKAELTEKLCLEGKSPGIKAAKALVDYSGPVLAMIGSAQKACSSTKKVMNFAALGMTAAKGMCVATKLVCDSTCGTAQALLGELQTEIAALGKTITADAKKTSSMTTNQNCKIVINGAETQNPKCPPESIKTSETFREPIMALQTGFKKEVSVEPGTTVGLIKSCEDKGKDIALMLMDITGMMMAKMSAQKCEEKLAATSGAGGGGANVASTKAYCEQPENSGTQFCKCQGSAMGSPACSGVAELNVTNGNGDGKAGANVKGGPGPQGFAGGMNGPKGSNRDFKINGAGGAELGSAGNVNPGSSAFSGGSNGASGANVSGGDSAGGNGKGGDGGLQPTEEKKWNFGSFGSSSGAGGGMAGKGGGNGNGELNPQQKDLIERKIASEKFRAEVSTASGLDNWSKIKERYINNANSFMANP